VTPRDLLALLAGAAAGWLASALVVVLQTSWTARIVYPGIAGVVLLNVLMVLPLLTGALLAGIVTALLARTRSPWPVVLLVAAYVLAMNALGMRMTFGPAVWSVAYALGEIALCAGAAGLAFATTRSRGCTSPAR
jgi:hypothetical protein